MYNEPDLGEDGMVLVRVLAAGFPYSRETVHIQKAVMDIVGYWSVPLGPFKSPDEVDGTVRFVREPGDYAVWLDTGGNWGIEGRKDGGSAQLIPISVQRGKVTQVDISLAVLEVGLLSQEGNAMVDERIWAHIPDRDVAGNKILGDEYIEYAHTDERGIATFVLAGGTYVLDWWPGAFHDNEYLDVSIQVGERKRVIWTVPY